LQDQETKRDIQQRLVVDAERTWFCYSKNERREKRIPPKVTLWFFLTARIIRKTRGKKLFSKHIP